MVAYALIPHAHTSFQVLSKEVTQCLHNCKTFITSSSDAIEASAPHIYLSAIPFAFHHSAFIDRIGRLFVRLPQAQISGRVHSAATVLRGHEFDVNDLACSPDKHVLASSGSLDGTVRIWDALTARENQPALTNSKGSEITIVNAVAFSPASAMTCRCSGGSRARRALRGAPGGSGALEGLKAVKA